MVPGELGGWMTNYIIICAGAGHRWHEYLNMPKQLVMLDGEVLLKRTVRLINEYDAEAKVWVVARTDALKVEGAELYVPALTPANGDVDKFLSSKELWNQQGRTVIVYGDVWFSDEAMKTICRSSLLDWTMFGRMYGSTGGPRPDGRTCSNITGGPWGEVWAISFYDQHQLEFMQALEHAVLLIGSISRTGGWVIYRLMTWTSPKKHDQRGRFVEIDDWTQDFDSQLDYDEWVMRRRKWRADPTYVWPYEEWYGRFEAWKDRGVAQIEQWRTEGEVHA